MKQKFEKYLKEAENSTKDAVENMVKNAWLKIMPNTFISEFKALSSDDELMFVCHLGKDKSEWKNGIRQNDPLSVSFTIDINPDGFVVEWDQKSLMIKPQSSHMAYSRKKFALRKLKASDVKALEKKLVTNFNKIKSEIKQSLDSGDLDVHGEEIVSMIKKKI